MHSFVLHFILLVIPFILIDVRIACFDQVPINKAGWLISRNWPSYEINKTVASEKYKLVYKLKGQFSPMKLADSLLLGTIIAWKAICSFSGWEVLLSYNMYIAPGQIWT